MKTRYAEREDLPDVYVMYLNALKDLNEEHDTQDALNYMLSCWARAPCVLLLKGKSIVGFAGLTIYSPAYNKKKTYLREYMFYIQPTSRGIRAWRTLCKAVADVADKFNLTYVGEHRVTENFNTHLRLIKMAGAQPKAIISVYEAK